MGVELFEAEEKRTNFKPAEHHKGRSQTATRSAAATALDK